MSDRIDTKGLSGVCLQNIDETLDRPIDTVSKRNSAIQLSKNGHSQPYHSLNSVSHLSNFAPKIFDCGAAAESNILLSALPLTLQFPIRMSRSIPILTLIIAVVFSSISGYSATPNAEEGAIFALVNQQRQKARLSALAWDESAARLARSYSRRMAREGFFDHYDPEGNSVMERADESGLKHWSRIGENLFVCDPMDRFGPFAVRGWLGSPTHRQNMLDREWSATGIGIARSRDGEIYITQVFLER